MSQTNTIEIQDLGVSQFRSKFIVVIISMITINLIFLAAMQLWISLYILIFTIALGSLMIFILYRNHTKSTNPTRVLISPEGLTILIPRTKPFDIKWSEFSTLKMTVIGVPSPLMTAAGIIGAFEPAGGNVAAYRKLVIVFYQGELKQKRAIKKVGALLWHDEEINKIVHAIVDFASNTKKEIVIDKYTKNYYKLEGLGIQ